MGRAVSGEAAGGNVGGKVSGFNDGAEVGGSVELLVGAAIGTDNARHVVTLGKAVQVP